MNNRNEFLLLVTSVFAAIPTILFGVVFQSANNVECAALGCLICLPVENISVSVLTLVAWHWAKLLMCATKIEFIF